MLLQRSNTPTIADFPTLMNISHVQSLLLELLAHIFLLSIYVDCDHPVTRRAALHLMSIAIGAMLYCLRPLCGRKYGRYR